MTTEKTITLYTYDELPPKGKECARDWWINAMDESDYESTVEDFQTIGEMLGLDFKTHEVRLMSGRTRQDPCIWYSLGYTQSDYASFDATYRYKAGCVAEIEAYAPQDEKLHAIARQLRDVQKRYGYRLTVTVTHHHYYGQQIEVDESEREVNPSDYEALKATFRRLSEWLYDAIRQQHEWLTEEAQIADAMEANGYTFREDGTREDA